jgi:hypothetical protein
LLTGYVLLDHVSVSSGFTLVGAATLVMGLLSLLRGCPRCVWIAPVIVVGMIVTADPTIGRWSWRPAVMRRVASRRSSRIAWESSMWSMMARNGAMWSMGAMCMTGRTNIDLRLNSNRVDRVYLLAALHPAPRKVLVIG